MNSLINYKNQFPVIILGAGGHAKVLINALQLCKVEIIGILDSNHRKDTNGPYDITILGDDKSIDKYDKTFIKLVNGIGSLPGRYTRREIFNRFTLHGYEFETVIHPATCISDDTRLGHGVQIMAGAVLQPNILIGDNSIINTSVSIDHDCIIGNDVHIAPGATLSGHVVVGNNVHIGTGASVIQGITIGDNVVIGAGSVIVKDVPAGAKVKPPESDSKL